MTNMDPLFLRAFFPGLTSPKTATAEWSGHRVLGRRLRPFSLWHLLVLTGIESPFVQPLDPKAPPSGGDLVTAVDICRNRYPEARVGGRGWLRRAANFLRLAGGGFIRQAQMFLSYRAAFEAGPEFQIVPSRHASSGEPRGQPPLIFEMVIAAMKVARCSRAEAWNLPPGEAAWYRSEWLRERGADVDFLTPEVQADQERLAHDAPDVHAALVRGAAKFGRGLNVRCQRGGGAHA